MGQQLTLNLSLRSEFELTNFYVGDNHAVLATISQLLQGQAEMCTYIWGEAGCGRSHLLQATVKAYLEQGGSAFYLCLADLNGVTPSICQDLEQIQLLCFDDVDALAHKTDWQEALFHLYNRVQLQGGQMLISANCPPRLLPLQLPDLITRLAAGLVYKLQGLTDEHKRQVLCEHARSRGMLMSEEVAEFILRRSPRQMSTLMAILDQLDQASLEAQRKLTIPFVKSVLCL